MRNSTTKQAVLAALQHHAQAIRAAAKAQAECHEKAMTMQPGTPERNTVHAGIKYNANRRAKHLMAYEAVLEIARTGIATDEEIEEATQRGRDAVAPRLHHIGTPPTAVNQTLA